MSHNHGVYIRPALPSDLDDVWPIVRDFGPGVTPEPAAFEASWQAATESPTSLVAVAERTDGTIVGYVLAHIHASFLANRSVAWVEEVAVSEHHRRAGIGRKLMSHAENWARTEGAAHLALASRRSGAFYRALGYEDAAVFYKRALS